MRVELYPVYSLYIHFDRFYNISLSDREYYQIRFKLKTPVFCKTEIIYEQSSSPNVIYPPSVGEGYGICKTIEVSSSNACSIFDDAFKCTIQVLRRFDTLKKMLVEVVIELYVMEHVQSPGTESFIFLTRRVLDIPMRLEKSNHVHRSIFFDSTIFSAVTLTIHSSLVSIVPVRKKLPPDPPTSDKLRRYHKYLCYAILSTKSSLQRFIRRYCSALSSPLHFDDFNLEEECQKCDEQFRRCKNGWAELEQNAAILSRIISQLFAQLLQMFSRSPQIARMLYDEFDQVRMRRLGELFVFTESPICKLLPTEDDISSVQVIEQIRKSSYYLRMPILDFYCSGTDLGPDNRSIILEEIYLPTGTPSQSLSLFSDCRSVNQPVTGFESTEASNQKAQSCVANFCIPLKCSAIEDPYVMHSSNTSLSHIRSTKFNKRRVSDPGMKEHSGKDFGGYMSHHRHSFRRRKAHSVLNISTELNYKGDTDCRFVASTAPFEENFISLPATSSSSSLSQKVDEEGYNDNREYDDLPGIKRVSNQQMSPDFDNSVMVLIHCKEHLKQKLHALNFQGYFYSDLAHLPYRTPYFLDDRRNVMKSCSGIHLVVLVHGLEGSIEDLGHYRNVLRLLLPQGNLHFLPSCVNLSKTWSGLEDLAENLLYEVFDEIRSLSAWPTRISFIAHSMGGLIVRAMLGLPKAAPLLPMLYTLLTLNAPHCGLLYNQRAAKLGVSLMRWWKQSVSLEQLCLRDAVLFRDTFLYKLSTNGVLGKFRYVLLVGSCQDFYVPLHSATITQCKAANKDRSSQRSIFDEMIYHMNSSMENSEVKTTVVKYVVYHTFSSTAIRTYQVIGKAAHIAVIDDDVFVERLLALSAVRYFI